MKLPSDLFHYIGEERMKTLLICFITHLNTKLQEEFESGMQWVKQESAIRVIHHLPYETLLTSSVLHTNRAIRSPNALLIVFGKKKKN